MQKLLAQLRPGDHVIANGQNAMFDHLIDGGGGVRLWIDSGTKIFQLTPDTPNMDILTDLSLVAKPQQKTRFPMRGHWFLDARFLPHVFWSLNERTMCVLAPHEIDTWRHKPGHLEKRCGWMNNITLTNTGVVDETGKPIEFFTPHFLPQCLVLPTMQLEFLI